MWGLVFVLLGSMVELSTQQGCDEICYEGYGCYDDCGPWACCPLPESPEQIGTRFRLHNRNRPGAFDFEIITPQEPGNAFDASKPTVFLVHGFSQSGYTGWVQDTFSALLAREDHNAIIVDWRTGANIGVRPYPASNTRVVGSVIAEMAQVLVDERDLSWDDVQCIGFSAGGQACGFFGKNITNAQVGRITGLDPAGDIFNHDSLEDRISAGDGAFVDIIHTNAFGAIPSGIDRNCGDVDFWANGGRDQPGCLLLGEICDHQRAPEYYLATIQNLCTYDPEPCDSFEEMQADQCNQCSGSDCQQVGITAVDFPGRGTYWFDVTSNYPHC